MQREEEIDLVRRCLDLHQSQTTTLAPGEASSSVERYLCEQRFGREQELIHRRLPVPYVHSSELNAPNSFRRLDTSLGDVLFTRDEAGEVHAFHNVCRHRGANLIQADSGSARRLVCPYHAWSYAANGELISVPAADQCFPTLKREEKGLAALPCTERFGLIWLCPQASDRQQADEELDRHLGEIAGDLAWLGIDALQVFRRNTRRWRANWKLLSEGGLETYHFKTAHKDTIGPYFLNNLSVQDSLGGHSRVIMPSGKINTLADQAESEWRLRDFTHTLFGVGPQSSFLAQEKHVDWIRMTPITVDETEIVITSLVPVGEGGLTEDERRHWDTNLKITLTTLDEDFEIGEGIQRGLASGANSSLTFGRNEGTLAAFNDWVEEIIG